MFEKSIYRNIQTKRRKTEKRKETKIEVKKQEDREIML